jgi:hypothetical protein
LAKCLKLVGFSRPGESNKYKSSKTLTSAKKYYSELSESDKIVSFLNFFCLFTSLFLSSWPYCLFCYMLFFLYCFMSVSMLCMVCQYVLSCICILFRLTDERGDINVGFAKYFRNNGNRIGTFQDSWQKKPMGIFFLMLKTQLFREHETFKSRYFRRSAKNLGFLKDLKIYFTCIWFWFWAWRSYAAVHSNAIFTSFQHMGILIRTFVLQRQLSRRDSKTSITSSWSSLFNVVSNENLSAIEQDTGTYRGRSRKE